MTGHKFVCGQHVTFVDQRFIGPSWSGTFTIAKLLPSGGQEPRYRIKSTGETYSRVALERQLSPTFSILR